jgi:hypothetical protein
MVARVDGRRAGERCEGIGVDDLCGNGAEEQLFVLVSFSREVSVNHDLVLTTSSILGAQKSSVKLQESRMFCIRLLRPPN